MAGKRVALFALGVGAQCLAVEQQAVSECSRLKSIHWLSLVRMQAARLSVPGVHVCGCACAVCVPVPYYMTV